MFESGFLFIQRYFFKMLFLQFILLGVLFFLVYIVYNYYVFLSVLYGGISGIIPSLLFFLIFFFNRNMVSPERIIKIFYFAGMLKMISLIVICACLLNISTIVPGYFFISLFFVQVVFWCSCVLFFNEGVSLYEC